MAFAGVAGGSHYSHTGGASNYLCLVMDPQLDNETAVPSMFNYLYGSEYDRIQGHHNQDVVCSVCRAPQATTLMIPATLTCPAGWTAQYKGHLVSERYGQTGRTEYVCLDEVREQRDAGHAHENGALFSLVVTECGSLPCPPHVQGKVVTECGSLPCPPHVQGKVVTCVVCSM